MSASSIPKLVFIILNWNTWDETKTCLESLSRVDHDGLCVILLDNGSVRDKMQEVTDLTTSLDYDTRTFDYEASDASSTVHFDDYLLSGSKDRRLLLTLKSKRNLGFAEGNNVAIRFALRTLQPTYILLLNNDTIVHKNFLNELVRVAIEKKAAICGGKILYLEKPGLIRFAGGKINLWKASFELRGRDHPDVGQFDRVEEVDYVEGSCMLISREVLERVGLFDPEYFAYWEDVDFCFRTKKEGMPILYVPSAVVWHKVGASTANKIAMQVYLTTRNRILFMRKHASFPQKLVCIPFLVKYMTNTIISLTFRRWDAKLVKDAFLSIVSAVLWHLRRGTCPQVSHPSFGPLKKQE